jgi:hypothetical protein
VQATSAFFDPLCRGRLDTMPGPFECGMVNDVFQDATDLKLWAARSTSSAKLLNFAPFLKSALA